MLYLHVMVASPDARVLGLANGLLNKAKQHADNLGLAKLALVAVQGSVFYWQRHGFVMIDNFSDTAEQALGEQARGFAFLCLKIKNRLCV